MKNKYSIFSLIKNSFSYHENWQQAWRDPEPKTDYDVVIVGGGGHGLATAYYLVKDHNLKKLMDEGLLIMVNSDDPAYFGGYLNTNLIECQIALNLFKNDTSVIR